MTYLVKEMFSTLQGEGVHMGRKAVFIRFVGCNMWNGDPRLKEREKGAGACAMWCDTEFRKEGSSEMSAVGIAESAARLWGPDYLHRFAVLTGGEPCLQLDNELSRALEKSGFGVALETNGTVRPKGMVNWLCLSPKLKRDGSFPDLKIDRADEVKVVLGSHTDWTPQLLERLECEVDATHFFVHPVDARPFMGKWAPGGTMPVVSDATIRACVEWVQRNPKWRMGCQLHKLIGMP